MNEKSIVAETKADKQMHYGENIKGGVFITIGGRQDRARGILTTPNRTTPDYGGVDMPGFTNESTRTGNPAVLLLYISSSSVR
jgi:hypothetical protein